MRSLFNMMIIIRNTQMRPHPNPAFAAVAAFAPIH